MPGVIQLSVSWLGHLPAWTDSSRGSGPASSSSCGPASIWWWPHHACHCPRCLCPLPYCDSLRTGDSAFTHCRLHQLCPLLRSPCPSSWPGSHQHLLQGSAEMFPPGSLPWPLAWAEAPPLGPKTFWFLPDGEAPGQESLVYLNGPTLRIHRHCTF